MKILACKYDWEAINVKLLPTQLLIEFDSRLQTIEIRGSCWIKSPSVIIRGRVWGWGSGFPQFSYLNCFEFLKD